MVFIGLESKRIDVSIISMDRPSFCLWFQNLQTTYIEVVSHRARSNFSESFRID